MNKSSPRFAPHAPAEGPGLGHRSPPPAHGVLGGQRVLHLHPLPPRPRIALAVFANCGSNEQTGRPAVKRPGCRDAEAGCVLLRTDSLPRSPAKSRPGSTRQAAEGARGHPGRKPPFLPADPTRVTPGSSTQSPGAHRDPALAPTLLQTQRHP